ncbi:hypothetical protein ABZP36_019628 [Zizania latifolia]
MLTHGSAALVGVNASRALKNHMSSFESADAMPAEMVAVANQQNVAPALRYAYLHCEIELLSIELQLISFSKHLLVLFLNKANHQKLNTMQPLVDFLLNKQK